MYTKQYYQIDSGSTLQTTMPNSLSTAKKSILFKKRNYLSENQERRQKFAKSREEKRHLVKQYISFSKKIHSLDKVHSPAV